MRKKGRTTGYYNIVAGSYGFQAGVQSFGYAMFFMNDAALASLDSSKGFEIGVGPNIVVLDEGWPRTPQLPRFATMCMPSCLVRGA